MGEINIREAERRDEQFLRRVYFSTRRDEVTAFGWDEAQQDAFLDMQFAVRQQAYRMQCPNAEYYIVTFDGNNAGTLIVDRSHHSIGLTDIAVLPEYRGKGIATYLIKQLQVEAAASSRPFILQVDKSNVVARALYENLNFVVTVEGQLSDEMKWSAGSG